MPGDSRRGAPANDDQISPPLPPPERIQELLFDAAKLGRVDMIPALLLAGADVSAFDPRGYTSLILASYHGHEAATILLLEYGASVDQPDRVRENTALMGAAFKGYASIVERLLEAGSDPGKRNRAGQTALMMAALFGHCPIVDRLIERGADPELRDIAGNSAVSVALSQANDLMVARLSGRPVHV